MDDNYILQNRADPRIKLYVVKFGGENSSPILLVFIKKTIVCAKQRVEMNQKLSDKKNEPKTL